MPDRAALEELIDVIGAEGLRELYEIFLDDAKMRLEEISARKNADGDLAELKRHAHSLKGVCRTYGLPLSGDLAFDLEQAVDNADVNAIKKTAQKVLAFVPGDLEEGVKLVAELTAD